MKLRPVVLGLHRYLGLIAAIPILLLCVTGAFLVFEGELDHALNRGYWYVVPQSQSLTWQQVIDAARAAHPADPVTSLRFPTSPDIAAELNLKSGLIVTVDPYTGKMLGTRRRADIFMSKVHQFHTNLLVGEWGSRITGVSALLLVILSFTGLALWWRRKAFGVKWRAPWRRVNYDAHHAMGIFGLLPWLILSLSGAAIAFESVVRPVIYRVTHSEQAKVPPLRSAPAAKDAKPLTLDAALAAVAKTLPGAETSLISLPTKPGETFTAFMKFPEDRTPAGRSRVAIDQFTGVPVWIENSRTTAAGTNVWNHNRPIHTGDIFGWPTRILACVACVVLAMQVLSGIWMWLPARRSGKLASPL